MPRILAAGLALCVGLTVWGAEVQHAAPSQRPDALMKAVTSEVTAILKHDRAAGARTDIEQLVAKKILPLFDFRRMTSMAVARNWSGASPAQQNALVEEFRTLLVRTYSGSLANYRDQEIEYKPLRGPAGATEVLVMSSMRQPGAQALSIDYEMADTAAGWKVYDVKVAGVSLVLNYRETFAAEIRNNGIDGLIKTLAAKNRAAGDRLK